MVQIFGDKKASSPLFFVFSSHLYVTNLLIYVKKV